TWCIFLPVLGRIHWGVCAPQLTKIKPSPYSPTMLQLKSRRCIVTIPTTKASRHLHPHRISPPAIVSIAYQYDRDVGIQRPHLRLCSIRLVLVCGHLNLSGYHLTTSRDINWLTANSHNLSLKPRP